MSTLVENAAIIEANRHKPKYQARVEPISQLRIQAIVDRVGAKLAEAKKPRSIGGDAFKHLCTVRHKHEAINALVLGQLQLLDPTIGDASCEMRVPLVLDMRDHIANILQRGDEALVFDYITAHASDKADTKIRTVADAVGAAHAPAYDDLVKRVETVLGEEATDLLRLCLTFTKSGVWSKDEFNLLFSFRSKAPMDIAGEVAVYSGDQKDLIKMVQNLRIALATNAVTAFLNKIAALPRSEALGANAPQFFIDNQLLLASEIMRSYVPYTLNYPSQSEEDELPVVKSEQDKLPLLPIFNQILAILYMLFHERRSLIVRVRRDEMTPIAGSDSTKQRYTQTFAGIYYLLFKPNPETGLFDVVDPTAEDMDRSFIVFDAWSKYVAGTNGTGLDAADLAEHREALSSSNIVWLFLQYAATHPDYAGAAADKGYDYVTGYDAVCMPQPYGVTATFKPTREQFPQLHLKKHLPNETRPTLYNLWVLASEQGEKRTLHDKCQAITGPFGHDMYERINRPVDFQIDHIFPASYEWVTTDTAALVTKHASAPDAVFGPFVVRIGEGCFSFVEVEKAQAVLRIKKDNQKKADYKKIHPENAAFVKA